MSGPKCMDLRQPRLRADESVLRQLMSSLQARPLALSNDHVQIRTSQVSTLQEMRNVQDVRMQDSIDAPDTKALQDKLVGNVTADYSVQELGDWQPVDMSAYDDSIDVTSTADDPDTGLRLHGDFNSAALGGCFAVLEMQDEDGEKSWVLSIDEALLDHNGEWKDKAKQNLWDSAVAKAAAASRAAEAANPKAKKDRRDKLSAAMRAANLDERSRPLATGATALKFSTPKQTTIDAPLKTRTAGGVDD